MLNDKLQQADVSGDLNRFIYTICGNRLKKAIGTFAAENADMMRIENKEVIRFSSVMGLRHDHAVSVRIDEDNVYYTFVVSASFLAEGDVEDDTEQMRISSRLRFSPEIPEGYHFEVLNVALEPMLVDPEAYLARPSGALNFTIAHECYHWLGHRAYIDFHRLMQKLGLEDSDGNAAWNEMVWDKEYAKEDLLEIQSNAIAGRILMPKDMFIEKFRELDMLYGKTDGVSRTVDELASLYCVSRQACRIRISEPGLWDFDEEPGAQETVFVSPADAFGLYAGDPEFMELADSGAVTYHDNSYFYNSPEYIIWDEP